jgi:bacteriocin biosynthesis cyclodehydratase domain-containing protein
LRPGLLPLWRDEDTVQIGIDPRRAIAISGMSESAEVIRLLDGSRDRDQILAEAGQRGVPGAVTERIIGLLAAAGAVVDFPSEMLRAMQPELRRQLMPVLATASLSAQDSDGGASILARRSSCTIGVCGDGPVATLVADLLTRSGLVAAGQACGPLQARPADLLVLVGRPSLDETTELLRRRQPYLAVCASEAIGVVGPLVRPGVTACTRCIDLAKAQRDPAWPLILAQLPGRSADPPGCDVVLATSVAAQAAAQAVAFADRSQPAEATVNATLELVLPSWQWRRRTWLPHPACICGSGCATGPANRESRRASAAAERQ